ncbi:MAG: redoxin [Maritimibacter sp.]|nr:redoxin [Maritimibacter sp.]
MKALHIRAGATLLRCLAGLSLALLLAGCSDDGSAPSGTSPLDQTTAEALGFAVKPAPAPLPELSFMDGQEQPLTLENFEGKVVLLNLWATWCPPCREEMPTLDRLQAKLGGDEFEVVALSIDRGGLEVIRDFFDETGVEHLALYNDPQGETAVTLSALGLPTTLLIDREGRELARLVGAAEWDSAEMVAFLEEAVIGARSAR